MKVFISWSGERTRKVAAKLLEWLPIVIHGVTPWMSPTIGAGRRWNHEIATQLAACDFGIACLVPEVVSEPWIHFEAGAIAKKFPNVERVASGNFRGRVVPYLIGMAPGTLLNGPLASFQAHRADRSGTLALLTEINTLIDRKNQRTPAHLDALLTKFWLDLESVIKEVENAAPVTPVAPTAIEEILAIVRGLATNTDDLRAPAPWQVQPRDDPENVEFDDSADRDLPDDEYEEPGEAELDDVSVVDGEEDDDGTPVAAQRRTTANTSATRSGRRPPSTVAPKKTRKPVSRTK